VYKDDQSKGDLCLILEVGWLGDLQNQIYTRTFLDQKFYQDQLNYYLYQLASALQSVHSKNVCHRDIKPHNIILDIGYECSLIDFGISKNLKQSEFENTTTGVRGTFKYLSPELMSKKKNDISFIDLFACDMWALGITLH